MGGTGDERRRSQPVVMMQGTADVCELITILASHSGRLQLISIIARLAPAAGLVIEQSRR